MVPALVIASMLVIPVTQAQDKPSSETEKQLIANERRLQGAVATGDKATFVSLVVSSGGFWATPTSDGFVPMNLLADSLETYHLTKWEIINPRVTWLDADSAIVSSAWTETGSFGDRPVSPLAVATTVWTKRDGKWVAVTHQETDVRR